MIVGVDHRDSNSRDHKGLDNHNHKDRGCTCSPDSIPCWDEVDKDNGLVVGRATYSKFIYYLFPPSFK